VTGHTLRLKGAWACNGCGCRDARDHQAVVLSCSHLARRWAVLECRSAWLVVDARVNRCSRETHSSSRASKIYGHNAFQITHLHITVINSGRATQLSTAPLLRWRRHCGAYCQRRTLRHSWRHIKTPLTAAVAVADYTPFTTNSAEICFSVFDFACQPRLALIPWWSTDRTGKRSNR